MLGWTLLRSTFGGGWCSLVCFGNHCSFNGLAGECLCLQVSSATSPHPADLRWDYSSSSQGDPAGARLPASALLSGLAQCGAALSSEQPDKDRRLGHGLGWLGLAAPGWAEEGAATPAQQRDQAGEARSCEWRDSAVPSPGAVPKLAVPERKEFLKSLTIPSLPETFPPSSCSEERFVPLWGCCRSLCQPSQGDTLGLPRRAERTVKKVPRKQRGGKKPGRLNPS